MRNMSSGFNSLHWQLLSGPSTGKTLPSSNEGKEHNPPVPPPGHHETTALKLNSSQLEKNKLAKEKDKSARPSSSSPGLQFCSNPGMSDIPSLCWCVTEAVVQVDQGSTTYSPGAESNPQPGFVNEVYWSTASPICLWIICGCLQTVE